jgi:hypothetical protein
MIPMSYLNTAIGLNYTDQSTADLAARTNMLSPGVSRPSTFIVNNSDVGATQSTGSMATYGWYVQPTFNFHSRFFASPGLRLDGGSASGARAGLAGFPKIDFSYLAINQDHPRGFLTLLRPRLAFGYAGTQPNPVFKLRLFNLNSGSSTQTNSLVSLDGGATYVPSVNLATLGNTKLRPEHTRELEGGFDLGMGDDRLNLTVTAYNKTRYDAIIATPLPPSVTGRGYAGTQIQKNIGVVRNTGTEVTASARLLDTRVVNWIANINLSHDRSKVVRLNPGISTIDVGNTRVEAGYPLWGVWARPIAAYFDANQDGIIESNEFYLADSAVFVGSAEPTYTFNVSTTLSLLNGRVGITANIAYEDGITQTQGASGAYVSDVFQLLPNAPGASLATQAAVMAGRQLVLNPGTNAVVTNSSSIGLMQTVNILRFQSVSINYVPPTAVARWFHVPSMMIALQGRNLGLYTNYRGADPDVNAFSTAGNGDITRDTGQIPQPRMWQLTVRLGN